MQVLSLCSGYGGLELALQRILTPAVPVAFCDIYGPAQQDVEPSFPTPTVMDMGWGRSKEEWADWIETQRAKHRNGNGHGRSLYQLCGEGTLLVMEHLMGLPTGYITNQGLSVGLSGSFSETE